MNRIVKFDMTLGKPVSRLRVVALDSEGEVEKEVWLSEEFNPPVHKFDDEWYEGLMYTSGLYNLTDYKNIPDLQFEILVDGEWRYYSNVVNDYYNL